MENRDFRPISRFISEMVQDKSIVTVVDYQWIVCGLSSIEWRHFQWPWTTRNQDFKVTPLYDAKYLRKGMKYRNSYIEILIWTYVLRPSPFEWPSVILADWLSEIFNDTKRRAVSLRQLSLYRFSWVYHETHELALKQTDHIDMIRQARDNCQ